ncbi:MAG: hypothetical protein UW95_C0013G0005 [Parcubacteria group bacterium GW2011_GWC1_45_14]|nr:MAG: hypothetical protein UW87_C0030G0004 [Candidatus Moranbacteria bacterium GW2011_GWC2_45_10]KKT94541.1 MAG: hypothetical protein UW95_C0013G0005 [Parcubacteria group bacterium GW2011_GWC1_45_14]
MGWGVFRNDTIVRFPNWLIRGIAMQNKRVARKIRKEAMQQASRRFYSGN